LVYDVAVVGAGRAVPRKLIDRPVPRRASKLPELSERVTGMVLTGRDYGQAQNFGVEMAIPDKVTGFDAVDAEDVLR
jgi:hypothetical protein